VGVPPSTTVRGAVSVTQGELVCTVGDLAPAEEVGYSFTIDIDTNGTLNGGAQRLGVTEGGVGTVSVYPTVPPALTVLSSGVWTSRSKVTPSPASWAPCPAGWGRRSRHRSSSR
jgi:hypothetical protein